MSRRLALEPLRVQLALPGMAQHLEGHRLQREAFHHAHGAQELVAQPAPHVPALLTGLLCDLHLLHSSIYIYPLNRLTWYSDFIFYMLMRDGYTLNSYVNVF